MRARRRRRSVRCPRRWPPPRCGSPRPSRSHRARHASRAGAGRCRSVRPVRPLLVRRARGRRRQSRAARTCGSRPTASEVGGRPASRQSSSLHPSTDAAIESSSGVQLARSSSVAPSLWPASSPNPVESDLRRGARGGAVVARRGRPARLRATTRRRRRRTGRDRCRSRGAPGRSRRPGRCRPRPPALRGRGAGRSVRCRAGSRRRAAPGARRRPSRWRAGRARRARGSRSARAPGAWWPLGRRPAPGRRGPGRPGRTQFRTRVQTRVSSGASSRATPPPAVDGSSADGTAGRRRGSPSASPRRPVPRLSTAATLSVIVARTVIIPPSRRTEDVTILGPRSRGRDDRAVVQRRLAARGRVQLLVRERSRSRPRRRDHLERRRHRDPRGARGRLRRPRDGSRGAHERVVPPQPARSRLPVSRRRDRDPARHGARLADPRGGRSREALGHQRARARRAAVGDPPRRRAVPRRRVHLAARVVPQRRRRPAQRRLPVRARRPRVAGHRAGDAVRASTTVPKSSC